jgi:4a-hydroxytetrahydrobiopterin dehydratase
MKAKLLTEDEIATELARTPGWSIIGGKLRREVVFSNFVEAFGFMTRAALVSEARNHHPEWLNIYNSVRIDLSTHAAGGLTVLDFEWARAANQLLTE